MGVLDQITKMRKQGIPESEIVNSLSQNGISPREISDALKQDQIKSAVSDFDGGDMQPSMNIENLPAPENNQSSQEYQPSPQTYSPQQNYSPNVQEAYAPQEYYPQDQQYAQQENYSQQGMNTDTMIEIADQIFSDKIRNFQRQGDNNSEAVALLQTKVENISERLKKIETMMDKLQIAILEKVGSYGQNLGEIKKEMSMMQDSFSKMISHHPKETKKKSKK